MNAAHEADAIALLPPCPMAEAEEAGPPVESEDGGAAASSEEAFDAGRDGIRRSSGGGGEIVGGFGRFAALFPLSAAGFLKHRLASLDGGEAMQSAVFCV